MSIERDLKLEIEKRIAADPSVTIKAVMGRASDESVKSQEAGANENDIYVTLYNGNVITVYNQRIPRIIYKKVLIGYTDEEPGLLQVLSFDPVYFEHPFPEVPNHKESHRWYSYDPVEVFKQQIMDLLPRAVEDMTVRVYGGEYFANGSWHIMDTRDIDLTSQIIASGAEWMNVEIDENGTISYTHGTNYDTRFDLTPERRPAADYTKYLLFAVMLYEGQTKVIQNRLQSDIFDPRFVASAGGAAASVDYDNIENTPDWWGKGLEPVMIPSEKSIVDIYIDGTIAVLTGVGLSYVFQERKTLYGIKIALKNKGSASSTIVDVNLGSLSGGTSIFAATPANRPEMAYDETSDYVISGLPDTVDCYPGDVLTFDIDQAATAASGLSIQVLESYLDFVTAEDANGDLDIVTAFVELE